MNHAAGHRGDLIILWLLNVETSSDPRAHPAEQVVTERGHGAGLKGGQLTAAGALR